MKISHLFAVSLICCIIGTAFITGCSGKNDFQKLKPIILGIEKVDADNQTGDDTKDDPGGGNTTNVHDLFSLSPGTEVPAFAVSSYLDPTGLSLPNDYDGDGISNDEEMAWGTNSFVANYPRITVRTSFPVIMELEYNVSGEVKTYSESIDEEDTKTTKSKNMDSTHYSKLNLKTTPYVVKGSTTEAGSTANSYGYSDSTSMNFNAGFNFSYMQLFAMGGSTGYGTSRSHSENSSFSNSFNHSSMSEKTVFDDITYHDNMDSNGVEIKDTKVMEIENKYRKSQIESQTVTLDKNAGVLRAAMYFKNESIDMPVKISNVRCTALLKMPNGNLQVLSTFLLKDNDGYPFEVEIGGDEETAPYAVVLDGINSQTIKNALRNGYIPMISLFSYDMTVPDGSTYQPGVTDLKQVEEAAKKRTAIIKISAPNRRELYRVAAFDVDGTNVSPGISLKKALFNIFRSPLKGGESWNVDAKHDELTVYKEGLWWHSTYMGADSYNHEYLYSANISGNEWDYFATEVKAYTDEYNNLKHIETIKRIGNEKDVYGNYINQKYNPFNKQDNPSYNENESLAEDQLLKTKYWVIMHNGKYFEGDINDPIWAGDRYEIVLFNIQDFRDHFQELVYTPLQSGDLLAFDTRWNALVNSTDQLARATRLGKIIKGDVIQLDVYLKESRFLFDATVDKNTGYGIPVALNTTTNLWWDYKYTFAPEEEEPSGIPGSFTHTVSGGVNSIMAHIEKSPNAQYYMIHLKDANDAGAVARQIRVNESDVPLNGANIFLNSKTMDVNGSPLGVLSPSKYSIDVFAHGTSYDHPVKTLSTANGTSDASAIITDASTLVPTNSFSFSVANLYDGKLTVRIQDPPNTEYYLIRIIGPFNYNQDQPVAVMNVRGYAGENTIDLDHPYGGLIEAKDPGVYEVHVFSINKNCYSGSIEDESVIASTESRIGALNVEVVYPQYIYQRVISPFKYVPEADKDNNTSAYAKSFNLNAIDLEVNFNEGSGWYRLKLANDDKGANGREIECRYTSVVEDYRGQHFRIYFKPPAGENGSFLNIFKSSDDEVDLYIRTVAEKRYRDTFWMKKLDMNTVYESGANAICTSSSIIDFISYWTNLDVTDASKFESSLAALRIVSPDSFLSILVAGLFEGQVDTGNYFFSPLEERKYYISATIADPTAYVETLPTKLDLPSFKATPGPACIYLTNMESRYADSYRIWWRMFDRTAIYEYPLAPEKVYWDKAANTPQSADAANWMSVDVSANEEGKCEFTVPNCQPNQFYLVAVQGTNASLTGYSDARFAFDKNSACDNMQFILPYPDHAPEYAPLMTLSTDEKTRVIDVHLSTPDEPDQNRFIIEWKSDADMVWNEYDSYDGTQASLQWGGTSYQITDLNPLTTYTVKAYARTVNNLTGPETIMTATTGVEGECSATWGFEDAGGKYTWPDGKSTGVKTNLVCSNVRVPAGTIHYTITGHMEMTTYTGWLSPKPVHKDIPFSFDYTPDVTSFTVLANLWSHAWWGIFHTYHFQDAYIYYTIKAYNENNVAFAINSSVFKQQKCPRWK